MLHTTIYSALVKTKPFSRSGEHTWVGTQTSGPTRFETNCEGSSAERNASRKRVFPRLKSSVVKWRSSRKLSVFAWDILLRSRSRAKNMMKAHNMIFMSNFRTTF